MCVTQVGAGLSPDPNLHLPGEQSWAETCKVGMVTEGPRVVCVMSCEQAAVISGRRWSAWPWLPHGWLAARLEVWLLCIGAGTPGAWRSSGDRDGCVTYTEDRPEPKLMVECRRLLSEAVRIPGKATHRE